MNPATQIIQFPDTQIEYLLTGKDHPETLLFLHGLGANLTQFEKQHEYFESTFKVLSINLRGHGQSILKSPHDVSNYQLHKMGLDVITLLQHLKLSKVHLIGNSMGGNIGYEILKSHPEKLNSFITFGTTAELNTAPITLSVMKFIYKFLNSKMIGNIAKSAGQNLNSKMKIKEMMSQTNSVTIQGILPHLSHFNYLSVIRNATINTLIIQGSEDMDINKVLKTTLTEYKRRGFVRLVTMPQVGHFANLDDPNGFNTILKQFIINLPS